jgi:hypothetical protein
MRKTLNLFIIFFSVLTVNAQKLQPAEVKDKAVVRLLGSITTLDKYTFQNNVVTVMTAKAVNSPHTGTETDEVADNLLVSDCETGEGLDCRLYALNNLTALKVDKVYQENGKIKVTITYGNANARKSDTIVLPSK